MKLNKTHQRPHLTEPLSQGTTTHSKVSNRVMQKSSKKTSAVRVSAHPKIRTTAVKLRTPSYLGTVGHALLRRCYVAGGWVQQGFEKVFTLTFFSKSGGKGSKVEKDTIALKGKKSPKKLPRTYRKTTSHKGLTSSSKAKGSSASQSKPLLKSAKLFAKRA